VRVFGSVARGEADQESDIIPFRFIDGIMECLPKILYSQAIEEGPRELKELEKHHRYTHLFQRVRMLRLLKSEECRNLGEAAQRRWATVGVNVRGGLRATGRVGLRNF
jgi:hypothetical protein